MSTITHILLLSFKPETSADTIKQLCDQFIALKETCIHPETKRPYVLSAKGGKDNSPEGFQKQMTHGFVMEFANEDDRKYYLEQDPSHKAFVEAVGPVSKDFLVLDFNEGRF